MDLSADADADEMVTLVKPEAGTYVAYVNGFETPGGGAYDWSEWVVGPASAATRRSPRPACRSRSARRSC